MATKRPAGRPSMTLDLNSPQTKRTRMLKNQVKTEILSSPDVQKLGLASPDMEKFITNPHSLVTPTQVFFPKNVTEEQELYAKGFVEALAQLQQDSSSCSSSVDFNNSRDASSSNGGPLPIDMASQEKAKLERKRQRNRIAASKCRKRKLERIAKLEDKVKLLKGENDKLSDVLERLRTSVGDLKSKIYEHVQGGCVIPMPSNE